MNPLFQERSRGIDFLAAPPLDCDVFSPTLDWEWQHMFYAAPDWAKGPSIQGLGRREVLEAWKRKGDYSPDLFWFAAPIAGFSEGFFGLSREDQNLLVEFWSDQLGNPIKPLPFLYMVKFVGHIIEEEERFWRFGSYLNTLRDYAGVSEVAAYLWGRVYRSHRGWGWEVYQYLTEIIQEISKNTGCLSTPKALEGSFPTWGEILPAIEQQEPVDVTIMSPAEILHTRWLAAYGEIHLSEVEDGLTEVDLVEWLVRQVDFELYEAVLPRSWAIERPGRAGIGRREYVLTMDDGEEVRVTFAVGLVVDPLRSRPVGVWEGDAWTRVNLTWEDNNLCYLRLEYGQSRLRSSVHPYFWGDYMSDDVSSYDEVVGWPHFVGVVAGRPNPKVGAVDLSQEIARMVARKTGLPYLGRR